MPTAPEQRLPDKSVREVLAESGLPDDTIDAAEAEGTDELLAIDHVVLPDPLEYNIAELADSTGLDPDWIRQYWRALGFADPAPGERAFSKIDVNIVRAVARAESDLIGADVGMQLARVLGLSMATFASAVVEAGDMRAASRTGGQEGDYSEPVTEYEASRLATHASELLPFLTEVMDYAFRRHLRAATRRRIALASVPAGEGQSVGFADMVRFTKLSQELDDHDLAELVTEFDELSNAIVAANGGRIVKMIGDEAMFTAETPEQAARIGLELVAVFDDRDDLPEVRVGLASGPVLARDGDIYGPVVNLASRLVAAARSDSVVVSQSMRDHLAGNPAFKLRSIGTKRLRHIGSTRIYRLKAGPAWNTNDDQNDADQTDADQTDADTGPPAADETE